MTVSARKCPKLNSTPTDTHMTQRGNLCDLNLARPLDTNLSGRQATKDGKKRDSNASVFILGKKIAMARKWL
ncbi:hypothetical protein [Paraburkholderia fungorum]|uniref:hypothetical protein n=1 Tax=Paraburkholderia fungorum TaxID=134537 RepID=UPI0011C49B38|nr:hypothetical protein [Paraburkholderia fungorum]